MIKFADITYTKEIINLWDIAFGEDKKFNDYYFKNIFKPEYTLIMIENNKLISMAQMLPYTLKNIGDVTYIYGAATLPECQGKGYMQKLLEKSFEIDIKLNKKGSVLIPAEKSLFDYYKRTGYETAFYIDRSQHKFTDITGSIYKATVSDIDILSDIYDGNIRRDREYWITQMNMFDSLGGTIYIYNNAYAIVSDKVDEIFGNENDKSILLNSICKLYNCDSIEFTTKGGSIPFGMIKKYSDFKYDNMYMNLMYN